VFLDAALRLSRPAKRIHTARAVVKSRWQQRESLAEDGKSPEQSRVIHVDSAASPLERYINLGLMNLH
jgi:hypothetical protein